tara:strand:+ start:34 stop:768 length:735 start_codon:yes stop_codon:yes gene_type:complete
VTDISYKTALVTGGAKRIGRVMCKYLAEEGWSICIHYLNSKKEADETLETINKLGGKAFKLKANLNHENETRELFNLAEKTIGPIGLLINNASIFYPEDWHEVTDLSWNNNFNINLKAPFILSQEFAKSLPKNSNGLILNLIDQRVLKLKSDFFSYTISKAALYTMTKTLALALAPRIRVNGIGPGPTLPNSQQTDQIFNLEAQSTLLRKMVNPEEIAETMMYLINSESVTGQMIAVDSGQHLS